MNKIALNGQYAYVTDSFPFQGLFTVNIDPSSASYLNVYGPLAIGGSSQGITAMGGYAYVVDSAGGFGMVLVDISDPTSPSILNNKDLGSTSETDILVSGKNAFVIDNSDGITILKFF